MHNGISAPLSFKLTCMHTMQACLIVCILCNHIWSDYSPLKVIEINSIGVKTDPESRRSCCSFPKEQEEAESLISKLICDINIQENTINATSFVVPLTNIIF